MSKVLGRCPKCGADYVDGYYGPYCTGKCGFRLRRVLGRDLTGNEITALLKGEKILLKDLTSRRTGNLYSMYVQPQEVEEYTFQNRKGEEVTGYRFKYIMTFPDWRSDTSADVNSAASNTSFNTPYTTSNSSGSDNETASGMIRVTGYSGGEGAAWNEEDIPFR